MTDQQRLDYLVEYFNLTDDQSRAIINYEIKNEAALSNLEVETFIYREIMDSHARAIHDNDVCPPRYYYVEHEGV